MRPKSSLVSQYFLFWTGQQLSLFGSSLVSFAIIWWLTIRTGSTWVLALASVASFGPMMSIQFVSGYITDYFNRKWILGLVDFVQAGATTILLVFFYLQVETVAVVLLILAIRGLFDGLHAPASGAIVPTMVPEEELQRLNSLNSLSRGSINLISPLLGALLVALFRSQFWIILSIDAITFLLAVIPLLVIKIPDVREPEKKGDPLRDKLLGGLQFLRSSTGLLPLLLIYTMFNFFITPVSMLTPLILLADSGFGVSEMIYGLVLMLSNLGFVVMSFVLSRHQLPLSSAKGVVLGFTITLCGLVAITYPLSCLTWYFISWVNY